MATEKRCIAYRPPFIRWLRKQRPTTLYGQIFCSCPLAKFSGRPVTTFDYGMPGERKELPAWAKRFVERFDMLPKSKATAKAALKIMGEIDVL